MGVEAVTLHERAEHLFARLANLALSDHGQTASMAAIESTLRDVVEECARVADKAHTAEIAVDQYCAESIADAIRELMK